MSAQILDHLARRPRMETRDVYKLLYQSVRGPEHIVVSPQAFRERLQAEWAALEDGPDDPVWELIRPDGSLLRVNLRPYQAAGGRLDVLADACLLTAGLDWGVPADLKRKWGRLEAEWAGLEAKFSGLQDYAGFSAWLEAENYPAVHHSEVYRRLYRPAYRLVAADYLTWIYPSPHPLGF
jgi:hypothetical protein